MDNKNTIVPLGMANYIGSNMMNIEFEKGDFGVLLNGPGGEQDNKMLISIANKFAEKNNLKYYTRCHPVLKIDLYEDYLNREYFIEDISYPQKMDIFVSKVSFAIVGNSTVFIDMLKMGKIAFRLFYKTVDIYEGIDWCRFQSVQDLQEKYEKAKNDIEQAVMLATQTRDSLCESGDIGKNYYDFYNLLVKEK